MKDTIFLLIASIALFGAAWLTLSYSGEYAISILIGVCFLILFAKNRRSKKNVKEIKEKT